MKDGRRTGAHAWEVAALLKSAVLTPRPQVPIRPKLSIVVVGFNMARELPRTIRSLSPLMQRGIAPEDYRSNSDRQRLDATHRRDPSWWLLFPGLVMRSIPGATVSPVPAINLGLSLARGDLVGVWIDGARIASPGLLVAALSAARLHAHPMIGTIAFHLGPDVQMESIRKGYNQAAEDALLSRIGWEDDGYRLFEISALASSSAGGWFELPAESNAVFLRAEHWRALAGFDERFTTPGGGLANLGHLVTYLRGRDRGTHHAARRGDISSGPRWHRDKLTQSAASILP